MDGDDRREPKSDTRGNDAAPADAKAQRSTVGERADRPRRAAVSGHDRSAATRERLLEAGLRCFSRHGYDATTTRMLAAEADVNLAAIPYHFDGKEGLYLAIAEHIAQRIRSRLEPVLARADGVAALGDKGRHEAAELIVEILTGVGRVLLTDEAALWAPTVLREQMAPSAAFDRLYDGAMRHVADALARLLAQCMNRRLSREEAGVRAMALVGQTIVFRASRAAVLRQLEIERMDAGHAERILAVVREHARAVLRAALDGELGRETGHE